MNAISKVFPYNQVSVIFILSGWVMNLSFKTFGPLDATSPVAIEVMAFEQKKCCLNRQLWDFLVQWNVPQLFGCNQLKQNNPVCCKHNNIYIYQIWADVNFKGV